MGMKAEKRRLILLEGYARAHPAIQAALAAGMDLNAALRFMKENCQPVLDEIWAFTEESLSAGHKLAHTRPGMYGYTLTDDSMRFLREHEIA